MGLFSFITNLFGPKLDSRLNNISRRVDELRLKKTQRSSETPKFDDSVFDIDTRKKPNELNTYTPKHFNILTTMRSLKEKRIELEKKRIVEWHKQVQHSYQSVQQLIDNENPDKAKEILIGCHSKVQELGGEHLSTYNSLLAKIRELKEIQLQKELERERIRLEKEKADKLKKEAEEQERKIKLEQERLRKEREAREYEDRLRLEAQQREIAKQRLTELITQKKPDSNKFLDYLRRKGIACFYHFTDEQNLLSIKKHGGLYSWYYCEQNNIDIPNAGGDSRSRSLDRRHGLEDYVRLSFCSDHPMQYRLQRSGARLVLLKIKVDVAAFKDTQFSNMNAAANAVKHGNSFEDLERVNIFAVKQTYVKGTDDIFHEHQAECMVKTFIPIEYITNINCPERL